MIKNLQKKIILLNMAIVSSVLLVILIFMVVVTRDNLRQETINVLTRASNADVAMNPWFESNESDNSFFDFNNGNNSNRINLPYFSVFVGLNNEINVIQNHFGVINDTDQLENVVKACMEKSEPLGELPKYNLRYLKSETSIGYIISFVDTTQENHTIRTLVICTLEIFLFVLFIYAVISVFFARWATKPVAESLQQQRQFISDASHELKTPLTVILSNADMLDNSDLEYNSDEARWLDNIKGSSEQMSKLVEELLVLARSDNMSKMNVQKETINFSDLVTDEVLVFEPILFEAGKELDDDITEDITISGNYSKLKQLIDILLDNARKYGDEGTVVKIKLSHDNKKLRLSVCSQGTPIASDDLEKIFERFYRADKSRSSEGFGLGLSIARNIADEHNGKIWAESNSDGNTFIFTMNKLNA